MPASLPRTPPSHPTYLLPYLSKISPGASTGSPMQPLEFLGPTSYSAVFRENSESIGENVLESGKGVHRDGLGPSEDGICSTIEDPTDHRNGLSLGVRILSQFPSKELSERLLDRHFRVCDVALHEPTMKYCLESIWATYGGSLQEPRKPESLAAMAEELCRIKTGIPSHCRSTKEWIDSFTGPCLRWEILSTLFAMFGQAIISDWEGVETCFQGGKQTDKHTLTSQMTRCAEGCLVMSDRVSPINEFAIWAMLHTYVLQSFYHGDASMSMIPSTCKTSRELMCLLNRSLALEKCWRARQRSHSAWFPPSNPSLRLPFAPCSRNTSECVRWRLCD